MSKIGDVMMIASKKLKEIILSVFPENKLQSFITRGYWVAEEESPWRGGYIIFFILNTNRKYCMKLVPDYNSSEWSLNNFMGELGAISLLQEYDFPVPNIVHTDFSKELIEYKDAHQRFLDELK